mmetsp:Transcript_120539/g.239958  ORF Transcript_120539/g.239958 Transcript_120539/m.239958 type:complete len:360 (+) Transcript_120539:92-1171(+)
MRGSNPAHIGGPGFQEPDSIRENFQRILSGYQPSGAPGPEDPALSPLRTRQVVIPPPQQGISGSPSARGMPRGTDAPEVHGWPVQGFVPEEESLSNAWPFETDHLLADSKKYKGDPINLARIFPFLFSFCCFMIFSVPIWLMVHLGQDTTVQYWMRGSWCGAVLLLLLPFLAAYFVHTKLRRPHKPTVLVCLLLPSGVLLVLGDLLVSVASNRQDQLRSVDCDTINLKRDLERSREAAQTLYDQCIKNTHNITAQAAKNFRLPDCSEFQTEYDDHRHDWGYLWKLEEEHQCGGWCYPDKPLFTKKDVRDSCSAVSAEVFGGKVKRMAQQVVAISLIVLVATSLGNLAAGPGLRSIGVDW